MLLDDYLPKADVAERHEAVIESSPDRVWEALKETDFSASFWIRVLMRLRGMALGGGLPKPFTLAATDRWGFELLDEEPPRHLVFALKGRFWTPRGDLQRIDRRSFFEGPHDGYARAAFSFELEPLEDDSTSLATETRVLAGDEKSRRAFLRYWRVIEPFSKLIRREMLRLIERRARA